MTEKFFLLLLMNNDFLFDFLWSNIRTKSKFVVTFFTNFTVLFLKSWAVQWLPLLFHSKKVVSLTAREPFCMEFACSPCVCAGSLGYPASSNSPTVCNLLG